MSIELHCPGCTKLIRAPADAGGKTGKCPYCSRKVYIPMPREELEPIPLAPIDPDEEAREAEMRRESANYMATVEGGGDGTIPQGGDSGQVIDYDDEVRQFIKAMHTSDLQTVERIVSKLSRNPGRSREYVQGTIVDEIPLAVEGVPPPLVQGFLKSLLGRLG